MQQKLFRQNYWNRAIIHSHIVLHTNFVILLGPNFLFQPVACSAKCGMWILGDVEDWMKVDVFLLQCVDNWRRRDMQLSEPDCIPVGDIFTKGRGREGRGRREGGGGGGRTAIWARLHPGRWRSNTPREPGREEGGREEVTSNWLLISVQGVCWHCFVLQKTT